VDLEELMQQRKRHSKCACQAPRLEGRCSAIPSCSDFKQPHQSRINAEARVRERERREVSPHSLISRRQGAAGMEKALPFVRQHRRFGSILGDF